MPLPDSINAAMFSSLAVATPATALTANELSALNTQAEFEALFLTEINNVGGTKAAGAFVMVDSIKEFPEMGIPANIVKVPLYGKKVSGQVNAQADAPTLDFTLAHIEAHWAKATSILGALVGTGQQVVIRFSSLSAEPASNASTTVGQGSVPNASWYWVGRLEARTVVTSLSDANTSKLTLSMQTDFFGAYTAATVAI